MAAASTCLALFSFTLPMLGSSMSVTWIYSAETKSGTAYSFKSKEQLM